MINLLIQLHKDLFIWMHNLTTVFPECNNLIYVLANKIDNYVVLLAVLVLIYFVYQSVEHTSWKRFLFLIKEMVRIITAVLVSWGISYVIKNITKLPRPFLRFPNEVIHLFDYGGFNSFPSGHATLFMALAVMISLHHKHIGYLFVFFAVLISIARVIAGIHFPIDILVGWILGGVVSLFIYKKLRK